MKYLITACFILVVWIMVIVTLITKDKHDNKICEKYGELNHKVVEAYKGACFVKTDKGWWKL